MHDINDLLELIKETAINAVRAEEPMGMDHGVVKKLSPLVIDLGDYTVEDDFIIVTGRIRDRSPAGSASSRRRGPCPSALLPSLR